MNRRRWLRLVASGVGALALSPWAYSQTPVRIVIGFTPGGSIDATARIVAEGMRQALNRPFIVENKTGASGRLAVEQVKSAPPNGETLLVVPQGPMTLFPFVYKSLNFDPNKDFTPIARLTTSDFVLAVNPQVPVKDVAGFKEWIKKNPDKANYGSPGNGTIPHFIGVQIARSLGIQLTHVAYKGSTPAALDAAGGQVTAVVVPVADVAELSKGGKIRILATTSAKRSPFFPQVPTLKESGIDLEVDLWYAMYGPAGLPANVVQQYQQAIADALAKPDTKERLSKIGLVAAPSPPSDLIALQKKESALWGPIVKASGFTPED